MVEFIRDNAASRSYQSGIERLFAQRERERLTAEQQAVDDAIRRGIDQLYATGQPAMPVQPGMTMTSAAGGKQPAAFNPPLPGRRPDPTARGEFRSIDPGMIQAGVTVPPYTQRAPLPVAAAPMPQSGAPFEQGPRALFPTPRAPMPQQGAPFEQGARTPLPPPATPQATAPVEATPWWMPDARRVPDMIPGRPIVGAGSREPEQPEPAVVPPTSPPAPAGTPWWMPDMGRVPDMIPGDPIVGSGAKETQKGTKSMLPVAGRIGQAESQGNFGAFNQIGAAGRVQMTEPRMQTLGIYSGDAKANDGKWEGTWNYPGVNSIEDFLANPQAQQDIENRHFALIDQEIAQSGADQYIGQTIDGVPVTYEGLVWGAHLAGINGLMSWLQGRGNPADQNGTSVRDYVARGAQGGGAPQGGQRGGFVPYDPQGRVANLDYSPLLRELTGTPGGGEAALRLLTAGQESAVGYQGRKDEQERLAMQALGRGDMDVFQFYAQRSGLQIPPEVLADRQASQLLSEAALLAEKLYDDQGQAAAFINSYIANNGDVRATYSEIGPPIEKPNLDVRAVMSGQQEVYAIINKNTQEITGYITDPSTGQPVGVPRSASGQTEPSDIREARILMEMSRQQGVDMPFEEAYRLAKASFRDEAALRQGLFTTFYNSLISQNAVEPMDQATAQVEARRMVEEIMPWLGRSSGQGAQPLPEATGEPPADQPAPGTRPIRTYVVTPNGVIEQTQ